MHKISSWKSSENANIASDACAYVTYYADNVAAFTDRREAENGEYGFDKMVPLASVFNILNGNHGNSHYAMNVLDPRNGINYPTQDPVVMNETFYRQVIQNITDNLKGFPGMKNISILCCQYWRQI